MESLSGVKFAFLVQSSQNSDAGTTTNLEEPYSSHTSEADPLQKSPLHFTKHYFSVHTIE